jgi:hypothetical protein
MDEKEFFNLCEKVYSEHFNNPDIKNDPFLKGVKISKKDVTISESSKRHYAGRKLLEDKKIFQNLKTEYIEKFLNLYPVNWSLFSELTVLTEEIIEKHIDKLALSKIFSNYKDRLSEEFIEKYNCRLGLVKRIELNLISISDLMMVFPDASKEVKKKIKKIVETSSNIYDDAIKLYVMLH